MADVTCSRTTASWGVQLVRDDNRQRDSMRSCVSDFFETFNEIVSPAKFMAMEAQGLSVPVYLHLFQPSLAWQMHQLAWGAGKV